MPTIMAKRWPAILALPLVLMVGAATIFYFHNMYAVVGMLFWLAVGFLWRFGIRKFVFFFVPMAMTPSSRRWVKDKQASFTHRVEVLWRLLRRDWSSLSLSLKLTLGFPFVLAVLLIAGVAIVLRQPRLIPGANIVIVFVREIAVRRLVPFVGRFTIGRALMRIFPLIAAFIGPKIAAWVGSRYYKTRRQSMRAAVRRRRAYTRRVTALIKALRYIPEVPTGRPWD